MFHFLSFSLSLLGAQNLIFFLGLHCVTISLDSSFVQNQFLGPSRVVISGGTPLGALFLFLSYFFFFSRFLSFFLLFIFHFLFISSFFDFLMFFIFHFSPRKSFFFSFFLYFFQIFLLLALVSEFNCFLRSRCSMEMWCPDDTGRDSWDWVGPPAWGRACFNSPEWGGGTILSSMISNSNQPSNMTRSRQNPETGPRRKLCRKSSEALSRGLEVRP